MPRVVRDWSLRRRLMTIAALACLATLVAGAGAMFWAAEKEDEHALDARLQDLSRTILSFSEHEITEIIGEGRTDMVHIETAATMGSRYRYQMWTHHGTLLLRSYKASATEPLLPLTQFGFATVRLGDEEFRVHSMEGNSGEMVIQVAECLDERGAVFATVSGYFLGGLVLPFSLIFLTMVWMLRKSMRSIDSSAAQLSRRSPIDLTPVQVDSPPREIRPMIDSINALFERITVAMSLERGFTAVAAHELRTPLAGLRAQAQIAATAQSPEELTESLEAVMTGVDRAARMLDQLLDLARIESMMNEAERLSTWVDVAHVYRGVMSDLAPQAAKRAVRMDPRFDENRIHGMELGVVLLMRNLMANAIRHSPTGGTIAIHTQRELDAVTLTIDDAGPGIAPEARQQVFERFYRLNKAQGEGVGLGMSIVQSVVEAHRAIIQLLESPLGGLRVQVRFPLKAAVGS
jgi:signal transduction histidine kinase